MQVSDLFDSITSTDVMLSSSDFAFKFCLSTSGNSYIFNPDTLYLSVCSWDITDKGYLLFKAKDFKAVFAITEMRTFRGKYQIEYRGERVSGDTVINKDIPELSRDDVQRYANGELTAFDHILIEQRKYLPLYYLLSGVIGGLLFAWLF